jgi:chromosomal replication initiator protein
MLLAPSQSPFRRYQAPRVAIVPIERVRPYLKPIIEEARAAPARPVCTMFSAGQLVMMECLESIRLAAASHAAEKPVFLIRSIIKETARHYGIDVIDLISERRTGNIIIPRHVAMFLSKTMTTKSYPEIARNFGGRDHSTVLSAVRKIASMKAIDDKLSAEVTAITQKLKNSGLGVDV